MPNKKIQSELASCAIFGGSKPRNAIRLQSSVANLANPVNFGRYLSLNNKQYCGGEKYDLL